MSETPDAMQFNTMDDYFEILAWMKACGDTCAMAGEVIYTTPIMLIKTATGTAAAEPGDWIEQVGDGSFRVRPKFTRESAEALIHPALHALGVSINGLIAGDGCHCNLITQVALDALGLTAASEG